MSENKEQVEEQTTAEEKNPQAAAPSEEEMKAKREEMIAKMKADLPDLEIEAKYNELITSIEGNRLARMQIQQQTIGLIMQGAPGKQPAGTPAAPTPEA